VAGENVAVAGENVAASAMILEHSPLGRRGYYASFVLQGVVAGQLIAAGAFLPLSAALSPEAFQAWGWRIPFLLSAFVVVAGYLIRRRVDETPVFRHGAARGELPRAPVIQVVRESWPNMLRVVLVSLLNVVPVLVVTFGAVYATNPAYANGFSTTTYLWISVVGNAVGLLVIRFVGSLSDHIGRRPCLIVGAIASGALAYPYLYAVHEHNQVMTFVLSVLMLGIVFQGCAATFPSFYTELFPSRTRMTGVAISFNIGTMITAFLPTVFAAVAPPGSDVVLIVGTATFGVALVGALAALSARETYRVHMHDLGLPGAIPVSREEYVRIRAASA
jgi:MFS family permease